MHPQTVLACIAASLLATTAHAGPGTQWEVSEFGSVDCNTKNFINAYTYANTQQQTCQTFQNAASCVSAYVLGDSTDRCTLLLYAGANCQGSSTQITFGNDGSALGYTTDPFNCFIVTC